MRGHIINRGNAKSPNWGFVVTLNYDEDGKRHQYWRSGFQSEREAQAALNRILVELEDDPKRIRQKPVKDPLNRQTLAEYLRGWMEKKTELRNTAGANYNYLIEQLIIPGIGKIFLGNLASEHIRELYEALKTKGYALNTRQRAHSILRAALEKAVQEKLIFMNPCFKDLRPKKENWSTGKTTFGLDEIDALDEDTANPDHDDLEPFHAMTDEEQARFLFIVKGTRFFAAHLLAIKRGLRRGEVLGLRWRDIDFKRHTLVIRRSLVVCSGKIGFQKPKTKRSMRTIHLSPELLIALQDHLAKQREEKMMRRRTYEDYDLVFPTWDGKPYDPNRFVRRHYKKYLVKAGLPKFRFHDLRHTAATMMIKDGVNVQVVSQVLGHASEAFTLRVYGHLLPGMQKMALSEFDS
jgi:integrase